MNNYYKDTGLALKNVFFIPLFSYIKQLTRAILICHT